MTTTFKVLGQQNPAATTATTLYTVPALTQTAVSTITVCNQAAAGATYRIAVRPVGAALAAQHYLAYDTSVGANNTTAVCLGITLGPADVVTVYASSTTVSFCAFGSEVS